MGGAGRLESVEQRSRERGEQQLPRQRDGDLEAPGGLPKKFQASLCQCGTVTALLEARGRAPQTETRDSSHRAENSFCAQRSHQRTSSFVDYQAEHSERCGLHSRTKAAKAALAPPGRPGKYDLQGDKCFRGNSKCA